MSGTDDRIDQAERAARDADLTGAQVASMQAYLLGAVLTHFDETPVVPMTDARWNRLLRDAIANATGPTP